MATNQPTTITNNEFQLFDCVATHIANTFDLLIGQLIARRDALLTALQVMKEDYISKETTQLVQCLHSVKDNWVRLIGRRGK